MGSVTALGKGTSGGQGGEGKDRTRLDVFREVEPWVLRKGRERQEITREETCIVLGTRGGEWTR